MLLCRNNELQRSVNDLGPYIVEIPRAVGRHQHIIELSVFSLGKNGSDNVAAMS